MSIKSKLLFGVMIVAALFVGVAVLNTGTAAAASCTISSTLKVGSKGTDVKCLQTALGITADGDFGPMTKASVMAWQKTNSLVADGIFGPKSRAVFNGSSSTTTTTSTLPTGCTSTSGYSPVTGQSCASTTTTTLPAGCVTASGYSSLTGQPCSSSTTTVTSTGPLTVSLASDSPAAGNLIQGQATADLAHFMFTGTGTLTQVTLQRTGISDNSVFPNVYLYNGNTRLTDSASVNSNGQIIFNGLNIPVSGSMDLSVKADIIASSTTGNAQSTVQVVLTSYMVSGATTANTVSVAGASFYVNSGTGILSSVNVGVNTVSAQSVSAGTTGVSLWSAPVTVSLHNVLLKSAAFDVIGSAPSNALANIGLYANGVKIASSTGVNSMGYLVFDLSSAPYSMVTGATTLEVRADVVNGSSRDLTLSIQHASDLMVTDSQVGVNVGITYNNSTFAIATAGKITILAGSLVSQADATFNSQTNVTGGATNVAIASWKLTSYGEDVKVNTITVSPTITGGNACVGSGTQLENVTLYWNGAPIGSSQNAVSSGSCGVTTLTFSPGSNLTIAGGTTGTLQVHADLMNGAGTNYTSGTIGATANITQYQGITSGSTSNLSLTGSNTMTISMGQLTVAKNAGYLDQTINPNTSQAEIASFTLQNQSTTEGVQVNSLYVGLTSDGSTQLTTGTTPATTNFSTLTLGGLPGTAPTPIGQPTGMNTFSTNFTIPAGGTQTVNVYANVGSTNSGSVYVTLNPVAVGATSRVSLTSTAVAGQHITLGVGSLATPALISSASTNSQYISSSGTGATNAAQETYNFVATNGTATITGLKFAALTATSDAVTGTFTGSTAVATTVTAGHGANYTVGDNVIVTTNGIFGGTTAIGTVSSITGDAVSLALSTPMVNGTKTSGGLAGDTFTMYKLATSGVTGVALNSTGVATGSASFSGGVAYLSSITGASGTGIAVPNNQSGVSVPVFMSFGPVSTSGGVASNTLAQIKLIYVQYQTGSNTSYLAPNAADGTQLYLVGSKPTMTLNSSTQTLTASNVLLGTLTVTADNGGDITLTQVPLSVSMSVGNGGATPTIVANSLKLTDTNGVLLSTLNTTTNSAGTTSATANEVFTSPYRISAGTSKTFEIHADFTGTSFGTSATASVSLGSSSNFTWGDINGGNAALTGANLYAYPSGSVSIHN